MVDIVGGSGSVANPSGPLRLVQVVLGATDRFRRGGLERWGAALLAILASFALRYWLDSDLPAGFPYLTFFPAVILTTFFVGLGPGIAVAIGCGLAAWYFFIAPFNSFALSGGGLLALLFYVFIVAVDISLIHWMHLALDRVVVERETAAQLARQRDLLFRELQHRVSNNLAVVSSILNGQGRALGGEAAAVLAQASARIALVAKIQRQLHDPARQSVDFGPYLEGLGPDLIEAAGAHHVTYEVEAEAVAISAQLAVPLGLITTELISNAIEHAFADGRPGRLSVQLYCEPAAISEPQSLVLRVVDDGPGWPSDFAIGQSRNLGMRIVQALAQQIGGRVSFFNDGGAVCELRFTQDDKQISA
ncbi:sensor histidine kinase [Consotaella salsifontis]|uniref:histidine kinase n=1 Tax=Consotaella salsifontis TaxID=1365950 RepID=A0A1T4NVU8_9HYPH|nr:histidine kinase dimerization/phosphoacceptor domain -containing protein [Consotaella salsifontis]SJZ83162.1 Two-component sensor histidine kinase, contains HisKA and HATPase domains [Consotaella salsifontis]